MKPDSVALVTQLSSFIFWKREKEKKTNVHLLPELLSLIYFLPFPPSRLSFPHALRANDSEDTGTTKRKEKVVSRTSSYEVHLFCFFPLGVLVTWAVGFGDRWCGDDAKCTIEGKQKKKKGKA